VPAISKPILAAALAAAALAAGCGADAPAQAPAPAPSPLPAAAVPYLDSRASALSASAIAHEAQLPDLAGRLDRWGFQAGARRYFQGESKRLQVVDARALRVRDAAGATAFVGYFGAHAASFFGGAGPPRTFASRGRHGVVVEGAPCACHLATPSYLGVVARGPLVTWLEINGPRASLTALRALAERAP
jgi:hypothetical protein